MTSRQEPLMTQPAIRPARVNEYDEIARVWMNSWVSTGFGTASDLLLAQLRARIPEEVANGWSLYVADDNGRLVARLALHLSRKTSRSIIRLASIPRPEHRAD